MQMPDSLLAGGTDQVDLNIAALNSHDGSSAFRILITPVRVVCANTQAAALADHHATFSIRHTRNAKAAVQAARDALGLTFSYCEAFEAEAERLVQTALSDAEFDALTRRAFATAGRTSPRGPLGRTASAPTPSRTCSTTPRPRPASGAPRGPATKAVVEYVDHYSLVRTNQDSVTAGAIRLPTSDDSAEAKRAAWAALVPTS